MEEINYPICGFVPPYILEAIASSNLVDEDARKACRETLKHAQSYAVQRQELSPEAEVSARKPQSGQKPLAPGAGIGSVQRNIYDCKGSAIRPGTLARSEGQGRVKDRQVNNCYDGFKIGHDFFSKVFGRNSLDGNGLPLVGSVHYRVNPATEGLNNAFWDGNKKHLVFGDGDHIQFDYLVDSLDVIAHEMSHGFVQFSSPLRYYWQAGALNESCADVFGCMIEQWHMKQTVEDADWNVGQTIFPVAFTGSCLRTMKAGKAYTNDPVMKTDPQPKHMDDIYEGDEDERGVHINSGIPNHAFYLAAKSLGGYSWEKAGKVWYKTMISSRIPWECEFVQFAEVTVDVAGREFPSDSSVKRAIRDAWVKVGVLPATTPLRASL